jgi:hypothetical protein
MTYNFRFEVRPEDEIVELQAEHHTAHVCVDCLYALDGSSSYSSYEGGEGYC